MRFGTTLVLFLLVASIFLADAWWLVRRRRRRTRRCPAPPPRLPHHGFCNTNAKAMWAYSTVTYERNANLVRAWRCRRCGLNGNRLLNVHVHTGRHATLAFTGYDPRLQSFILSFRGSVHFKNWLKNVMIRKRSPSFFSGCGGKVHRGFLSSYEALRGKLINALRSLMRSRRVRRVFVIGHSLGGAMATIAAPDLRNVLRMDTLVYTFSSPRVGDSSFVNYYNRRIATSWRIYNRNDLVSRLPPRWWPWRYRHVPRGVVPSAGLGRSSGHSTFFNVKAG